MSPQTGLPAPAAALFPDRATRTRIEDRLTRELADAGERVLKGPVDAALSTAPGCARNWPDSTSRPRAPLTS